MFDFEGDGIAEVVYHDELFLRIFRGTDGVVLFQTPNSTCTATEYPAIVDVDNDGNAEIVASRNQICGFGPQVGIAVFGDANDTWVPTRRIWNQHAYYITNVTENGAIPANPANNWQVAGLNNFRLNTFTPDEGQVSDAPDLTASFLRCEDGNAVARVSGGSAQRLEGWESGRIVVYGSDFAVNGSPVPYGVLPGTQGVLTGILASGLEIITSYRHAGYDGDHTGIVEVRAVEDALLADHEAWDPLGIVLGDAFFAWANLLVRDVGCSGRGPCLQISRLRSTPWRSTTRAQARRRSSRSTGPRSVQLSWET